MNLSHQNINNHLNRDFHVSKPNEKWVTDITRIPPSRSNDGETIQCKIFSNSTGFFRILEK